MSVQDLCPFRPDSHVTMTISAAAYALALDALNNGGIASLSRLRKNPFKLLGTCLQVTAKNMNVNLAKDVSSLLENLVEGVL